MVGSVRTLVVSRFAAAALAFALSGAPALARGAPRRSHACACASHARGGGACACQSHARAGATKAPPCHGREGGEPRRAAACARIGACGAPDAQDAPPRALDPFAPSPPPLLAEPPPARAVVAVEAPPSGVERSPESPPPRRA